MSVATHGPARVLIAFYSRTGSVEGLAKAVAEGARGEGAEVRLRRAREVVGREVMDKAHGWVEGAERMNALYEAPTEADAEWADAIVFGSPTRFGSASSELRAYIDGLGNVWSRGVLNGKVGSVFGASASPHGGNESTLLAFYNTLAHLGMIIVPLGYSDMVLFKGGTPYGATAVTGQPPKPQSQHDLDVAVYQGRRVTKVAAALRVAR
ncbi:MAG: NAD(P)H:quinone oxidoreductase [Caulobacteraceae bacterium]